MCEAEASDDEWFEAHSSVVVVVVVEVDDEVLTLMVFGVGADLLAAGTWHSSSSSSTSSLPLCDKLISFASKGGAIACGAESSIAVSLSHSVRHSLVFALLLLSCAVVVVDLAMEGGAGGGLTGRELSGNLGAVMVGFAMARPVRALGVGIVVPDEEVSIGKSR